MFIRDTAAATSHEVTPEGFLRLRARIGRAGLHDYEAHELGQPPGFTPNERLRVYRPPDEVFDPASMASFAGKPVTDRHPPAMVDAANWRRYAVGHAGETVSREGDHLVTDLVIADADAAARARQGMALSNGYHADIAFEPGTTPEGEAYDALQRNIRGNHIALVEAGRCGDSCHTAAGFGDCACGSGADGADPTPPDPTETALPKASPAHAAPPADGAALADAATLDALVEERVATLDGARRLLGPAFRPEGLSTKAIRRFAVERRLGTAAVAGRDDPYVSAAFDTLLAAEPAGRNPLADHLAGGLATPAQTRDGALAARHRFLQSAWKGAPMSGDR